MPCASSATLRRSAIPRSAQQAEAHYQQALALAEELGMRPLVAHCHLAWAPSIAKTASGEQARAELSTAIELYRAMEMTFWLPQAEAALAQVEEVVMDLYAVLDQIVALLQRRGRVTYNALKLQ